MSVSPEVEESEDEDPDEVDEVPVEAGDLDGRIVARAVVMAAPDLGGDNQQHDHAGRDVEAVKAGDHEEGGAELLRAPGIAPGADALVDELGPFEGLHGHERRAESGGGEHQGGRDLAGAAISIKIGRAHV